jgi:predicted amidohydrolase
MNKDIINIAVLNFKVASGNKEANLKRIVEYSEAAAKRGADLVLFPEMCLMGYDYFIDEKISRADKIRNTETIDGHATKTIAEVAKKNNLYIVFGMSEKLDEKSDILYNSAIVTGPEGVIGSYQKIHPYGTENTWCTKGENPFMFDTPWGSIAVGVCYDSYQFPELVRYYVYKGARLYLNPTAVVEEVSKEGSREAFVRCYTPHLEYAVLSSSVIIASSNLTGYDGECYFGGGSMVIGPKTNAFEEIDVDHYIGDDYDYQVGMHIGTVDLSLATRHQCISNPYANEPDFRPEIYKKFYE